MYWHGHFQLASGDEILPSRRGNVVRLAARRALFDSVLEKSGGLSGKSVVDLGCADGYFSFRAAELGAAAVLGVDRNRDEIEKASYVRELIGPVGANTNFECLDVLSANVAIPRADVVLCLGLLYHIFDHKSLIEAVGRSCADVLVIDTDAIPLPWAATRIEVEGGRTWLEQAIPVSVPTLSALKVLAYCSGFKFMIGPAKSALASGPVDYRAGRRVMVAFHKDYVTDATLLRNEVYELSRPSDDQQSEPFSRRYPMGSVAYRLLASAMRALSPLIDRW